LLGVACLATGRVREGEIFLGEVYEANPGYRDSAALLQLGRFRVRRGDPAAAEPLRRYLEAHPHHVEARFLLSRACALARDPAAAAAERARCWQEYETELPYQRRHDRIWAWRARPSRPLVYAAAACCGIALVGAALQRSMPTAHAAADVRSSPTPRSSAPPAR
jgi:hypothetical protein